MDIKLLTPILTAAAFALYVFIIISIPVKSKKIMSGSGKLLMPLTNGVQIRVIAIFAVCALVMGIVPFTRFQLYIQVIFLLTGLLGCNMAAKEACGLGHAGVYERQIIWGTYWVLYDDIEILPTLSYEDDPETLGVDKQNLQIIKKDGSQIVIVFTDKEERAKAVELILKNEPRLKP